MNWHLPSLHFPIKFRFKFHALSGLLDLIFLDCLRFYAKAADFGTPLESKMGPWGDLGRHLGQKGVQVTKKVARCTASSTPDSVTIT